MGTGHPGCEAFIRTPGVPSNTFGMSGYAPMVIFVSLPVTHATASRGRCHRIDYSSHWQYIRRSSNAFLIILIGKSLTVKMRHFQATKLTEPPKIRTDRLTISFWSGAVPCHSTQQPAGFWRSIFLGRTDVRNGCVKVGE